MPGDRKEQVKEAVISVAACDDIATHPNIRPMRGEWDGCFRLRVGSYRVIFLVSVADGVEAIDVLLVGPRGDIY
jgi:mRNA-degrading endonuclease RelE of RelBE toxin-antitoxin system